MGYWGVLFRYICRLKTVLYYGVLLLRCISELGNIIEYETLHHYWGVLLMCIICELQTVFYNGVLLGYIIKYQALHHYLGILLISICIIIMKITYDTVQGMSR